MKVEGCSLGLFQSVESCHWFPFSKHEIPLMCFFYFIRLSIDSFASKPFSGPHWRIVPFWPTTFNVLQGVFGSTDLFKITSPLLFHGRWEFPTRVFSLLWTHIRRASGRSLNSPSHIWWPWNTARPERKEVNPHPPQNLNWRCYVLVFLRVGAIYDCLHPIKLTFWTQSHGALVQMIFLFLLIDVFFGSSP